MLLTKSFIVPVLLNCFCFLMLVLLTDNWQPIRSAGSDPAGTLTVAPVLFLLVFNVFFLLSYGNPAEHTTVKDSHGESYGDKTLWLSKTRQWKSWHCDSQFTGTLHSQWLQSQVGCASTASCHSSGCTQWLAILSLERKLDQNCCVIILWFMLLDMDC